MPSQASLTGTTAGDLDVVLDEPDSGQLQPFPFTVHQAINSGHVAVDPHHPETLFSASFGSGVRKTTDGGSSWFPVNRGLVNLMIEQVAVDPFQANYIYAMPSFRMGNGVGQLYRSTDNGASWQPLGDCEAPFSREQTLNFDVPVPMNVAMNSDSGKSIWTAQAGSATSCGGPFRSLEDSGAGIPAGKEWCGYHKLDQCDTSLQDGDCPSGSGLFSDDFAGSMGIDGTSEAYAFASKQHSNNSTFNMFCSTVYRTRTTDPNLLTWDSIDEWDGSVTPGTPPCTIGRNFQSHRTYQVIFDPDDPDLRFSSYKLHTVGPGRLHELHIAYHDGLETGGFRHWDSALDLLSCFDFADEDCDVAMCGGAGQKRCCNNGPNFSPYQFWRTTTEKTIVGMGPSFSSILRCDTKDPVLGSFNTQRCWDGANWECIWNSLSVAQGGNGGCSATCSIGQVAPSLSESVWDRMVAKREPGADSFEEILLRGRRLYARDEFLRVFHDSLGWHDEHLKDPQTCASGYGVFTPVQLIQYDSTDPDKLWLVFPRHWFCSSDGGSSWSVCVPVDSTTLRTWERAPIVAQGSLNPTVLFSSGGSGLYRSTDSGATFLQLDSWDEHAQQCDDDDWDSATAGDQGATCRTHPLRCGRVNTMCGGLNQVAVDPTRDDRVYAATEEGIWRFTYPFDGSDPAGCRPLILPQDLTIGGRAYSGELGWTAVQPTCATSPACVIDKGFLSIAVEPGNVLHLLAGGKTQPVSGGDGGVFESTDGGATWTQLTDVDQSAAVFEIVFAPSGAVFVASEVGLYKRPDVNPTTAFVRKLPGVAPSDPPIEVRDVSVLGTKVYAASGDDDAASFREGLYESTDSGETFVKVLAANRNQNLRSVLAYTDSTLTDRVLAGTLGEGLRGFTPIADANCSGRLAKGLVAGTPGSIGMGTALAGVGDTGLPPDGVDCSSEWASVEFKTAPLEARIRILDYKRDDLKVPFLDPVWLLASPFASLVGVGDLDGDGCPELAIGLPVPASGTGVVRILNVCTGVVVATLLQPTADQFGMALARDGDLLAVGAPGGIFPRVFIYQLSSTTPPLVQTLVPPPGGNDFGWSLAFGDMDGDGLRDLAVGAPDVNFQGDVDGNGNVFIYRTVDWALIRTIVGGFGEGLGFSLSSGYDHLGPTGGPDGKDDLAIGAPGLASSPGAAYWLSGFDAPLPPPLTGSASGDRFGFSVLFSRDVDDDGFADLMVGAPGHDGALGADQGRVYVYNDAGVLFCNEMVGSSAGGNFGRAMAEGGDVDSSRTSDVLIGEPLYPTSGRAWLRSVLW